MKKRVTKATVWLLSLIPCAALFFTGCTPQTKVYCDTDTLKIERTGNITTVYDLAGDDTYTFRTVRVRKDSQNAADGVKTARDTDTIKIEIAKNVIIVEDKTTGAVYTID